MKYRPEIDGLRAVAVVSVIVFHSGLGLLSGGFVGVDVFFVISGYLITSIIVSEKSEGTFSLPRFYQRRARRILPALFLVILFCLPLAWIYFSLKDMKRFAESVIGASLSLSNIIFWNQSGYFDTTSELKPLLHTWSLGIEEQFYIFFPLFLLATWRLGIGKLKLIAILIFALSLGLASWGAVRYPAATFFLLPARAWEIALGSLIALSFGEAAPGRWPAFAAQSLSLAGLLLILGSCVAFDENTPFPSLYALAPTVGTALLIIFATPETLVGRLLASPPLVGIGLISYGAYLWHQPLFAFARYGSVDRPGAPVLVAIAVLAFGLAYLMWRFVERPFRNRAIVSTKALLLSSTTAIVLFVAFGLVALKSNGFDKLRISELQRKVLLTAARNPKLQECHTGGIDYLKPASACEYFFSPPEWAVLGNSHGVELAYALAVALKPRGVGVKQLTFSGCAPAYGREDHIQGCSRWTKEAVEYIESNPGLQNVVLSYKLVDLVDRDSGSAAPDEQELAEWNSYAEMIGEFVKAGKKVFVIVQAPELPKDVDFFIRDMTENDVEFLGGVDEARWNRSIAFIRDRLGTLPDTVTIIDPADYFCNGTMCAAVKGGEALYFDGNHMSLPGVRFIVDEILRRTEAQSPRSATASPR